MPKSGAEESRANQPGFTLCAEQGRKRELNSSSALSLITLPSAASASRVMGFGHDDGDLIQPGIQLRQPVDAETAFIKIKLFAADGPFLLDRGWDRGIVEPARGEKMGADYLPRRWRRLGRRTDYFSQSLNL